MSAVNPAPQKKRGFLIALVAAAFALGALGAGALLVNIAQRKQEAKNPYVRLAEVTENDTDPARWGTNWPREYDGTSARPTPPIRSTEADPASPRASCRPRRPRATRG